MLSAPLTSGQKAGKGTAPRLSSLRSITTSDHVAATAVTITETTGHVAVMAGHDQPKGAVTIVRKARSRCRNHRSRWAEIRKCPMASRDRLAWVASSMAAQRRIPWRPRHGGCWPLCKRGRPGTLKRAKEDQLEHRLRKPAERRPAQEQEDAHHEHPLSPEGVIDPRRRHFTGF